MTEGLRERTGEEIKRRNPRWVAPIVVWLASEESGDVTGRVFEAELGPKVAELMKQACPMPISGDGTSCHRAARAASANRCGLPSK